MDEEYNELHPFQAMDRTHMVLCHLDDALEGDPTLKQHPHLLALYENATDALAELYQGLGKIVFAEQE